MIAFNHQRDRGTLVGEVCKHSHPGKDCQRNHHRARDQPAPPPAPVYCSPHDSSLGCCRLRLFDLIGDLTHG